MVGGEEPWWGEEARRAGPQGRPAAGGRGRPKAAKPRRSRGALRAVSLRAAQTGRKAEKATL